MNPIPPEQMGMAEQLEPHTVAGKLWRVEGDAVRCLACGHQCRLPPGERGVCRMRFHAQGVLRVPFGYVAGWHSDPIEKKPFYHVLPGSRALTFGMVGCNFHCDFCQNWVTSQTLRERAAAAPIQTITPEALVDAALADQAATVVSSYNEPMITVEWAAAVFAAARARDRLCAMVSNGYASDEALEFLRPRLDALKIDLKGFHPGRYRELGGTLDRVTRTLQSAHALGWWLEVVTLLIPGFNDDPAELRALTQFLAGVSPSIPWHVTAFHPDYRRIRSRPATARDLLQAAEIGSAAGLHFVYAGNLPGATGDWENTRCPNCHLTLITRQGYRVGPVRLTDQGVCPACQTPIPGIWRRPRGAGTGK